VDPTACLERWRLALRERDREEEDDARADARADLLGWIARGGFELEWQPGERKLFIKER
jgi:hypothetical protein